METLSKEDAQTWANALRSGEFKQGHGALEHFEHFCCLGVACKIFIPEEHQRKFLGRLMGGTPISQEHAPGWLKNINTDLARKVGVSFIALNDNEDFKYSFDEIADVIELVYVHGALDEQEG